MSEHKYIIFLIGSLAFVPTGILLAILWRRFHDFVFMFLVFGTCMPSGLFGFPTDINFLSREWYRGTARGIEISYLDLLAIILLVSSLIVRRKEGRKMFWPPTFGLLLANTIWCTLNVAVFSDPNLFGILELSKFFRAVILFLAVATYVRSPREVYLFIWTLVATVFYEAAICLRDRYVYGGFRIRGTLAHPNSLSMYCLQCVPILVVAFFARDVSKPLRVACVLGYMAAAGCILLTVSRTGFASLVLLSGAAFFLSTGFKLSARNVGLAALGMILITLMIAKSWDTTMSRLGKFDVKHEYLSEEGDRGSYFRQAAPAIADNPIFGVGLNNWSWWISNRYSAMAGYPSRPYESIHIPPNIGKKEGHPEPPAHNLYLLTVTELGWPGLFLLMAFLLQSVWINGKVLLGKHESLVDLVRLGAFLSIGSVMLQSWTEWEFRQTSMFFLGHMVMAVGATLYYYRDKARPAR